MAKKGGKKDSAIKDDESRKRVEAEARSLNLVQYEVIQEKRQSELSNSKLNGLKIQTRWRDLMRLGIPRSNVVAKSVDLKKQIEVLAQIQARRLDRKLAALSNLKINLSEAEEQYNSALQHHIMNVNLLNNIQSSRLETLKAQYQSDLTILEGDFGGERLKIHANQARERANILGIMARAEHSFQETEADAKHDYSSVRDDVKNKNLEEKHALRIQLEGTVEDLWRQFQVALNNYNLATEERKKQFEDLKSKDQKNAKEIEVQMKRLGTLQENIALVKSKMGSNVREYDEINASLQEGKIVVQDQFQALKKSMNVFREEERARLTELTLVSTKVINSLTIKVDKAEKIIKLAEMNRKLETESERLLPFYETKDVEGPDQTSIILPHEFEGMEQFSKRFNKIYLDKMALNQKHNKLVQENDRLEAILNQYEEGITISETVLDDLNPLFVVNGKTNAAIRPKGLLYIPFVEASHTLVG